MVIMIHDQDVGDVDHVDHDQDVGDVDDGDYDQDVGDADDEDNFLLQPLSGETLITALWQG